ncbi:MAG: hypothetical protein Q9209_000057 [Squamulea sp. 1 TL-2023]
MNSTGNTQNAGEENNGEDQAVTHNYKHKDIIDLTYEDEAMPDVPPMQQDAPNVSKAREEIKDKKGPEDQEKPNEGPFSEEQRNLRRDKRRSEDQKRHGRERTPGDKTMSEHVLTPEMQESAEAQRQLVAKQEAEAQQKEKASAARRAEWIPQIIGIPEQRRTLQKTHLPFQQFPWPPMNGSWVKVLASGSDRVITEDTCKLQTSEMWFFLELRNAMSLVEEILGVAAMMKSTVQDFVDDISVLRGNVEIPYSDLMAAQINYALKRVVQNTIRLDRTRLALGRSLIVEGAGPIDMQTLQRVIPKLNHPFAANLVQCMPQGANGAQWEELNHEGIRSVMANALELKASIEGWKAESDHELLLIKDQLIVFWDSLVRRAKR